MLSRKNPVVTLGGEKKLSCEYRAYPTPDIVWRFKGVLIKRNTTEWTVINKKFPKIMTTMLFKTNVSFYDQGDYSCIAINSYGAALQTFNVHIAS